MGMIGCLCKARTLHRQWRGYPVLPCRRRSLSARAMCQLEVCSLCCGNGSLCRNERLPTCEQPHSLSLLCQPHQGTQDHHIITQGQVLLCRGSFSTSRLCHLAYQQLLQLHWNAVHCSFIALAQQNEQDIRLPVYSGKNIWVTYSSFSIETDIKHSPMRDLRDPCSLLSACIASWYTLRFDSSPREMAWEKMAGKDPRGAAAVSCKLTACCISSLHLSGDLHMEYPW